MTQSLNYFFDRSSTPAQRNLSVDFDGCFCRVFLGELPLEPQKTTSIINQKLFIIIEVLLLFEMYLSFCIEKNAPIIPSHAIH